ncbi:obscurin isoform X3 [Onthophagus taurus]|uniref:obscurin isoform X3 n=1 Tax=Onthophagus taurus TaxID=166361 RepID=UPI0039BE7F5B
MFFILRFPNPGEILVAWQSYKAKGDDELTLQEGDVVELLDTTDPAGPTIKRMKMDPNLDVSGEQLLDASAAKHKLSVKPRRTHTSSRHSPTRTNLNARWLVKKMQGDKKKGWVPCQILQSADEPTPGSGTPGDAAFRRQAVVSELVETEQEFVRDVDFVVQNYLINPERDPKKVPKVVRDNMEMVFGTLREIGEFHRVVLMEGVKYYANEPALLGKAFLRLERDFDKHVNYCMEEPIAQAFLDTNSQARDYFDELSHRLGDDKSFAEHLKLPIQRINDYQLLLKELVRYSACLGEDSSDLQKALELMLSVPHRAQDDKFTNSIEGYRGSIHKLGRLLAHDWFSVNLGDLVKERYLFLFKARILICKVRRISDERSVFQLKDIIRLPQVDLKDHQDDKRSFELIEKTTNSSLLLTAHRENVKEFWLKEIREFAGEADESGSDDIQITSEPTSPPTEPEIKLEVAKPKVEEKPKEQPKPNPPPKVEEKPKEQPKPNPPPKVEEKPKEQPKPNPPPKVEEQPKPNPPPKVEEKPKEQPKPNPPPKVEEQPKPNPSPKVEEQPKPNPPPKVDEKPKEQPKPSPPPKVEEKPTPPPKEAPKTNPAPKEEPPKPPKVEEKLVPSNPKPEQTIIVTPPTPKTEEVHLEVSRNVLEVQREQTTVVTQQTESYSIQRSHSKTQVIVNAKGHKVLAEVDPSYKIGVQVDIATEGLAIDDDMSRKYTEYTSSASARSGGYEEAHSRRTSSRSSYATEGLNSKYGLEGNKYESSSLTSKYSSDLGGKYSSDALSKYGTDSSKYGEITTKYGKSDDGNSRYGEITATRYGKSDDGNSKYGEMTYSRRTATDSGDGDAYSSSYTRRSIRAEGRTETDDDGDRYSRKSMRSLDRSGGLEEQYSYRKSSRSIDRSDDDDSYRKSIRSVERKTITSADDDSFSTSRRRTKKVDDDFDIDEYISKQKSIDEDLDPSAYLSKRRSIKSEDTEDSYSARKLRREESIKEESDYKKLGSVEEDRLARFEKYSRRSSELAEKIDTKSYDKKDVSGQADREFVRSVERETTHMDAISLQMKAKKDITAPPEERPLFTKTLSGHSVEPGCRLYLEVALAETPDSVIFLKDYDAIHFQDKRFIVTSREEHTIWRLEIKDTVEKDSGLYTAVATNAKGKSTCSTRIFIHRPTEEELHKPHFEVQLRDTELLEDTYLRFMIKVKGDPHPEVTFFKDNVKISDTNERIRAIKDLEQTGYYELVIPEVKGSDAGNYRCVAVNNYGEASCEAKLTVTETKRVFEDVIDKEGILPPGEKPSFAWRKDGKEFDPEERFKVLMGDDEDSLALIFQHVRPEDAGLYTCVAQTTTGHISCSAELTVQGQIVELHREPEKPSLVIEHREALAVAGGQAMLELQVKGFPKPKVKLSHEGKPVEAGNKVKFLYEDEESLSVVIKNVQAADAGKYEITAENELGQDIREMVLTVQAPPSFKSKVEDISIAVDQTLKMSVQVDGIPKPTIQFYKDGKEIKSTGRSKITEEGDTHTLIVEKTVLSDSGSYSVVASNSVAQVSKFWNTNVYTKPRVLKKIGEHIVCSKQDLVVMSLTLESEPVPEISWFKDGQEISSSDHYLIENDGNTYILKISGAVTTDSASYKCRAKNIHGSVDDEIRVDVKTAPRILKPLTDMTVTEHDKDVTLDVKVEAYPKPKVKWFLDEMELSETRSEFTRVESDDGVQLVIKEVTTELSGVYSCKLVNELGGTETSAKLTVNCKPRIIKHLKDTTVEEGATLHLEVEVEACPEPTVKWLRNGNEVSADARIKISRDTQRNETYNLTVNLIKYEEEGEYEVQVTNSLGTISSKSFVTVQKVTHTDAEEVNEEPPKKLIVEIIEEEEMTAKYDDKVEIEEVIEEPKEAQDTTYGITVNQIDNKSQQGVEDAEEVKTPKPKRLKSVQIEEIDIVETEQSKKVSTEDITPKRRQSKVATTEEVEIEEIEKPHEISDVKDIKVKSQRSVVATTEEATIQDKEESQVSDVKEIKVKPQVSVVATTEEIVEEHTEEPKKSKMKDVSNKPRKSIVATTEEAVQVEHDINKSRRKSSTTTIKVTESQKGIKSGDDELDEDVEELLNRAKRQRSLIEDVKVEETGPQALPVITDTNMKDRSQYESLGVSYMVRGTANPPPTATWTVDGKVITPKSPKFTMTQKGEEFRLDIKKLEPSDAGVYQCVLSNPVGEAKHQAKLDIIPEGEFRRPKVKEGEGLKDQSIVKKNTATMKAIIIGDPVPDVTWYFNGKEMTADEFEKYKIILESEDREIEDDLKECTYSLTIPRCERENGGTYTIKAKNKWGVIESSGVLNVILRPEIKGPEDIKVVPGFSAEFKTVIQSNPIPSVIWTRNDNVVEPTEDIEIIEDVANEVYILRFKTVKLGDEGYYKVIAKNNLGEDSSEGRLKVVTERPKFITGLNDGQVEHGGEITLMVRADGLPRPTITWFLNDKVIEEGSALGEMKIVANTESQVSSYLTITDFGEKDAGIYKVTAVNVVGDVETHAVIHMTQTPPSFSLRLIRNLDVNEGEPLTLKAKVTGSPKPTMKWYKDGEEISPENERIKTELLPDGNIRLHIDKITPADSGAYKIVVKNVNGESAALCAVAVTPNPQRPKFTKCIKDQKLTIGEPLRLEAMVSAYPPPEIKWLKDGLPVRPSSNIHLEHHPDGKIALVVDAVKPENAGKYTLIVSNKLGDVTGEANVETERRPTRPEFITRLVPQEVVEGFPVKFEVKASGFPQPKISWVRNGAEIVPDGKHVKLTDLPDGTSILVLEACHQDQDALTYRAIASNEAGEAETYAPLTVKPATKQDQPEERPLFLHQLKDVITDEGEQLKLEVPFTANPIPSVAWTKDDQPIVPSDRIMLTCDGRKVGLVIDKAIPSDAGHYAVTLSNPLGKDTTSGKATVHKVFAPPKFTQRFTDLQQLPTRDAKFIARVSGVPYPEVQWFKDDKPLHETDKYRIKRDGDVCCLYVNNSTIEDGGIYKAVATNKEGQDICEAKLEVVKEIKTPQKVEAPYFMKRLGDTELYKGMTAKFTACAAGTPEPSVQWYRNDEKLFPSDRIRMVETSGLLRLTIAGVDQDDLGKYSCKIFNEHGEDICHAQLRFDEMDARPKRPMTDQYTDYDKYKKSGAPIPLSDAPIISRMTDRRCTISWKPSIPSGPRAPVTYQLEMLELPHGDWFTVRSGIRGCVCDVGNLEPFRDYKFRIRVENKYGISDPSPFALTHRQKLEPEPPKFMPYLPPGIDFRPDTSPYFPKDFDIDRPPHDNMAQPPRFLRREHDTSYGVKDQNTNMFWFVYGYPKPKMTYYFNDIPIESGGRFDMSYTRNGQATLFINKMLERDVGWYEAVAINEHGEARQRIRLEIAELPMFIQRPDIEYVMMRGKAKFCCRIVGVPYPEVKWYKDWKPLATSSRTKIQYLEPDTHILIINDAILKDEGLYSVSARNVAGTISSSAMLHVEENDLEFNIRTYNNLSPIKAKRTPFDHGYDLGDELGRGTQGITYHAVERLNGRNYAAKLMHGRGDLRPFMYNELDVMNQLRHRKLVSLHDAYETDDSLTLVMELCGGGELVKDYLLKRDYYTESEIAGYVRQMLEGLEYMHEKGFGHMGLNIGDLLLSHPGSDSLKITDFGLSRRISMGRLMPLKYGVPEYVSPECAKGEGTGLPHDMWSIGIITYILLSGISPFRGERDKETLIKIQEGKWEFEESWWKHMSFEARDFITKLLVYQAEGRMDVHTALRHPWLERCDKLWQDEYQISTKYLRDYFVFYREWYDNASCKNIYRRRPLEGAFTHASRMVYPPGERYTPPPSLPQPEPTPRKPATWEDQIPSRSPLNYEIGAFKSESHYQSGPDTYLLQLRDVDFPVRIREYMKVAASRGPGAGLIVSDDNGYDWRAPSIRERRRFTDIMDEEIDDERKARIQKYGAGDTGYSIRRLRHEIGARLDTYAEAEAFLESRHEGRLPFFREKPDMAAMQEGKDLEMSCYAVGDPTPIVQWFKNDAIIADSHRIKIETDSDGRSHIKFCPALSFDLGTYKVVARNKIGQTVVRTRIVLGLVPDEPDSPEVTQTSDTEALLIWKQPKFDGHAPVQCYSLQYKLANDTEWTEQAYNIDHEFYLMTGLKPGESYIFRLSAKNSIGWSEPGVASQVVITKPAGAPKIQLSKAMMHLQNYTDSGQPPQVDPNSRPNYSFETNPVDWIQGNAQERYEFISEISRGRFSAVLKAVDKRTDTIVVAKVMDLGANATEVDGEFAALRSLRHERIAGLLEAYRTNDVAVFIQEKLQGADVLTYLASRHEYTEQTVATIVTQTLDGLQYLHWRGLCHLDLQPDNVVMSGMRTVQVKLVDFGCAHRVTKLGNKVPIVGHQDYMAPEVLAEEPAFPLTDIWSLGVLMYVMLSGTLPFKGEDLNETKQNILFVRYRFENLYQEVSQEGVRFLMLVFKRHPNKRPTAEECHENRWLLPTDFMIKKRERAVFLGNRLKEYCEQYHAEKAAAIVNGSVGSIAKGMGRSHSITDELLAAP